VYYALANDPDAASELLDAPERKQFAMLQKFADKVTAAAGQVQASQPTSRPAPAVSKAPPPVAATSGSGRAVSSRTIYDDDCSMDDYLKLRCGRRSKATASKTGVWRELIPPVYQDVKCGLTVGDGCKVTLPTMARNAGVSGRKPAHVLAKPRTGHETHDVTPRKPRRWQAIT